MECTEKTSTTTISFDVKVQLMSKEKGELVDAIAAGSKLTKADAGREVDIIEDWIDITIDPSEKVGELPKIEMKSHSKLTKADSGRVITQ
ncbi:MAG: hypothetical protein U0W65_13380 [Bacteroidia bacterium]